MSKTLNNPVLVLNKSYTALKVIKAKEAFTLLAKGSAEVVDVDDGSFATYDMNSWADMSKLKQQYEEDYYEWTKTVRQKVAVPTVIRLLRYNKVLTKRVRLTRRNIYKRDGNRCQYCGKTFKTSELSLDHVKPQSRGGENSWENLVCACVKCNNSKANNTPEEAGMKLIRRPVRPKINPDLLTIRCDSWRHFLSDMYWNIDIGENEDE